MRVAICDDAPDDAADIAAMVKEYASVHPDIALTISVFPESAALLGDIGQTGTGYDLYLLDILLSGQGGIELARTLRRQNDKGRIVFVTMSPDYALPAFSVKASDYLLKPVARRALFSVLDDTCESLASRPLQRRQISFRTPSGLQTVPLNDVVYVEVMGHVPYYHLSNGVVRGSELRIPFEQIADELMRESCFIRPHRSYLVNAAHITSLGSKSMRLDNGVTVPIARMRAADTKSRYLDYLSGEVACYA